MKYEFLIWIIIGVFVLIGIIVYFNIESVESKIIKNKEKGRAILSSLKNLIFILYLLTYAPFSNRYDIYNEKKEFTKYNTPQVDSTMYLSSIDNNRKIYYSLRNDSVYHSLKRVDYDWITIDKITDEFYNKKKDIWLEMIFIKSSIFRKEERTYKIIRYDRGQDITVACLTELQKDSVLKAWGFTEKLYKEDNRY